MPFEDSPLAAWLGGVFPCKKGRSGRGPTRADDACGPLPGELAAGGLAVSRALPALTIYRAAARYNQNHPQSGWFALAL